MLNRAIIVDENFVTCVKTGNLPHAKSTTTPQEAGLSRDEFLQLFESQLINRHLDLYARVLKDKNLSYYTIGSSGHEGNAAIAKAFRHTDMAFLHYRSGAFVVERARQVPSIDIIYDLMLSFVASSRDPISAGRHKVLGSLPLFIPPQTSTIASHIPKAVGTAFSINLAKELAIDARLASDSVVLCSFGDAGLNHSVTQGALNSAAWIVQGNIPLPLVFICEDNGIGISVPTTANWVEETCQQRIGIHYLSADGLNLADTFCVAQAAEYLARQKRQPVFLHMRCVRLLGHAGSDVESQYRTQAEIEIWEKDDPLLHSARIILEHEYLSAEEIIAKYHHIAEAVKIAGDKALLQPKLSSAQEVMSSVIPPASEKKSPALPTQEQRFAALGEEYAQSKNKLNLCQSINHALADLLLQYKSMVVFGEDVAKKGGVYRVTADLMKKFGKRRVFDSLLDETTILGNAIGLAHNGFIPVPEIQFLAYLHNAEDQLRGEASTLSFFSNGQYTNPMVIRIASLAYQKGFGGHFHNDNSLAVLRDIPGIIIACPSNGTDAAKMLRTCIKLAYEQQRIVVFLEPIALYMTKDLHETGDQAWSFSYSEPAETIALGEIGVYGKSKTLTIITYGNGYYLSRQAAHILEKKYNVEIKILDLRWLAPLNEEAIVQEIKDSAHVLIVDECRRTGSQSEALITMMVERLPVLPKIKRMTGLDSFIPLGKAWEYILPSCDDIVKTIKELLEIT